MFKGKAFASLLSCFLPTTHFSGTPGWASGRSPTLPSPSPQAPQLQTLFHVLLTSHLKYQPSSFPTSQPGPAVSTFSAAPHAWCPLWAGGSLRQRIDGEGLVLSLPLPPSRFAWMPHLPSLPSQPYSWLESIHPPKPVLNT